MKFTTRILPVIALVLLGLLPRAVLGQVPNPANDPKFASAVKLEAADPDKAVDEYARIRNEESRAGHEEIAAESLLRSALFTSDPVRYGTPAHIKAPGGGTDSRVVQEATSEMQGRGEVKAHEAVKELLQHYPRSAAALYAVDKNLKGSLEERIDRRNSHIFSYQLVDRLVSLTGAIPAFSYWFALLLIAVVVKLATLPLSIRMYKSQREMQRVQPLLKEIQEKYKGKPELTEKTMAIYKEHGVNPFASCLPLLIQMPFLFWVYNTIRLYEFHFSRGTFLWMGGPLSHAFPNYVAANLAQFDIVLLIVYASSNYLTMKLTPPTDPAAAQQQQSMSLMMTVFMFWMFMVYKWSAAFMFYWLVLNILTAVQQYYYVFLPNRIKTAGAGVSQSVGGNAPEFRNGSGPGTDRATNGSGAAPETSPLAARAPRPRPPRRKR